MFKILLHIVIHLEAGSTYGWIVKMFHDYGSIPQFVLVSENWNIDFTASFYYSYSVS